MIIKSQNEALYETYRDTLQWRGGSVAKHISRACGLLHRSVESN